MPETTPPDHPNKFTRLNVVGVYIKTDGYPNVKYKVQALLDEPSLHAREFNSLSQDAARFAQGAKGMTGTFRLLQRALRFAAAHVRAIRAILALDARHNIYIPYPAVFVLYFLSFIPAHRRPRRIHADAFISLYDTIVNDRRLLNPRRLLARILRAIEARAYMNADVVLVDTELNARHMSQMFSLPLEKFFALPLSINEQVYTSTAYLPHGKECRVLFIGTFVPLQGTEIIAQAIVRLSSIPSIHFRVIGDGQTADRFATILREANCTNVSWERKWQDSHGLAREIVAADICLGIFGAGEKADRVWPLKNYAYMAVGRALITADSSAARDLLAASSVAPFSCVKANQAELLANNITELAGNSILRSQYARQSRQFYERYLSHSTSAKMLLESLMKYDELTSTRRPESML
jgi:glycosyltransferase involved in cell wall biosynthesis